MTIGDRKEEEDDREGGSKEQGSEERGTADNDGVSADEENNDDGWVHWRRSGGSTPARSDAATSPPCRTCPIRRVSRKVVVWEHRPEDLSTQDERGAAEHGGLPDKTCPFKLIAQLEGHESEVKCCAWNSRGSLLALWGRDKSVWLWECCFLPGRWGRGGEFRPVGERGLEGGGDNNWGGDFECLAVLQGHRGDVKSVAFGPSHGHWREGEEVPYSVSYDDTVKVWAEECGDWYCAATLGTCDDRTGGAQRGAASKGGGGGGGAEGDEGGGATATG
ncbi:hypothetical protein ACHAWF_000601, partial [Thalassiosira exigua]